MLATPVGRARWALSHLLVTGVGAVLIMLLAGLQTGSGRSPRLLATVGWALVAVMVFVGNFATLLQVPDWVYRLSPLDHPAQVPVEPVAWAPLLWLLAVTLVGVLVGLIGLRRRQIGL